jgi:hypothetical protein
MNELKGRKRMGVDMKRLVVLFAALMSLTISGEVNAKLYKVKGQAPNWCEYAKKYLIPIPPRPAIDCAKTYKKLRCIKLNNYGCLWQVSSKDAYNGTDIKPGLLGAHDGAGEEVKPPNKSGHALFTHPKWSISAKLEWFYRRSKGKSALELARSYMNWCDVQGTHMDLGGWHRSCGLADNELVPGRRYCRQPKDGKPLPGQCDYCNCPDVQAAKWVRGTGRKVTDPLVLFEDDGTPKPFMITLALRNSVNELGGYKPNSEVVELGIAEFKKWLEKQE